MAVIELPVLLNRSLIWSRRKYRATRTPIAMTAMMSAYSVRVCASSSSRSRAMPFCAETIAFSISVLIIVEPLSPRSVMERRTVAR